MSVYRRREHELRYELVLPYVKDKTVLDIGCGYGYGAAMLAKTAKSVTAIDLNSAAIGTAAVRYRNLTNLTFLHGDAVSFLQTSELVVDVSVIYEVIEHLEAQDEVLRHIWRATSKDGRLFISTPNRLRTPFYRKNPFHLKELSLEETNSLVRKWFDIDVVKGQIQGLWAVFPQSFLGLVTSKLGGYESIVRLNAKPANSMTIILSGLRRGLP
ncbi:MAG: methyltransferase domain-containing protein [Dehalococcoidales bacterium]|nr:methyltransferase domain-containing protein [Dehalococcoidales bacterium]